VIDDDFSSIGILSQYISLVSKLKLLKSFLNPSIAVQEIRKFGAVDFLFLDINMPISGLDIAKILRDHVKYLIFVTGHPENALAAFNAQGDGFLVKPVSFAKFLNVLNKAFASKIFWKK
jgi:two-component system LytT family response regulator